MANTVCRVEDCGLLAKARGMCGLHYARWRRRNVENIPIRPGGTCVSGCDCGRHGSGAELRKNRVVLICKQCGNSYEVPASQAARRSFCSNECFMISTAERVKARRATGKTYNHDMTQDEFDQRMAHQKGLCAICNRLMAGRDAQRDHCHVSGEWRGILCGRCNKALGLFEDDPVRMLRAADYVMNGGVNDDSSVGTELRTL